MAKSRPGKYDHVLPGLPKLPPSDLSYQEKVQAIKDGVATHDAVLLANNYLTLRRRKDELNAIISEVNTRIEAFEQLLAESQEIQSAGWGDYGVKDNALRLPTGETIRVQPEPYGQVKDKEAFRLWCLANGYERQMHLWPTTRNAIVKERLLKGEPEPDGCETFSKNKIVLVGNGSE